MTQHLFIYGTLGPGRPNEHVMAAIGGEWQEASVRGQLKQEGWGADMGYPGIILDQDGDTVDGYIFSSDNLNQNWDKLDDFEGTGYQRVLTQVTTKDGKQLDAYIYTLK